MPVFVVLSCMAACMYVLSSVTSVQLSHCDCLIIYALEILLLACFHNTKTVTTPQQTYETVFYHCASSSMHSKNSTDVWFQNICSSMYLYDTDANGKQRAW